MDSFYLVWQPSTGYTMNRHTTYEEARREAERLALLHPGKQFFVLQAQSFCTLNQFKWEDLNNIPF